MYEQPSFLRILFDFTFLFWLVVLSIFFVGVLAGVGVMMLIS